MKLQVKDHLFGNYRRAPVAFSHGRGARLWDTEGREYLDFVGGVAVSSLGHAHPALVQAISDQAARYLHVSNLYQIPEQERVAAQLAQLSGLPKALFVNSGTEANEAAIKLVRKFTGQKTILTALHGFHGRTLGSLAATGNSAYHEGFGPLPGGFIHLPYGDLEAWDKAMDDAVGTVLIEPLQGEGGILEAPQSFWTGLQSLCRQRKKLLILDEVQTGIGRTGHMFAFQGLGLEPDLVTLAKGLGGGVPIGAMLAREELAEVLGPGSHGCTFGGNPLACAAASVVLDTVPGLLPSVRQHGQHLKSALNARGQGLLLGVEVPDAKAVEEACRHNGLLVNAVRPTTLRLAPPLVVTDADTEQAVAILRQSVREVEARCSP